MARPRSDTPASASADSPPAQPPLPVSFEEAMGELEDIVHALESEPLPLEDLVGRYERGMSLLRQCRRRIDSAQLRIEQITQRGDDAAAVTVTAFSPTEPATANAPVPSRPKPSTTAAAAPSTADDEIRLF